MKQCIIFTAILSLCAFPLWSQKKSAPATVKSDPVSKDTIRDAYAIAAKVMSDKVIVRWAPANYSVWQLANATGYVLERAELDAASLADSGLTNLTYRVINGFPKKPYTLQEWKSKADTTDLYIATAAHAQLKQSVPAGTGMEVLHNLNTQQASRHAMGMVSADLHAGAAEGLALRYEDIDIKRGNRYVYRVFNVPSTKGILTDTAYIFVDTRELTPLKKVEGVFVENGHNQVRVDWNIPFNAAFFTAYHVERAEGQGAFRRLTQQPYIISQNEDAALNSGYTDTTALIGRKYRYRVIGLDAFAMEGLPSNDIEGAPADMVGPPPVSKIDIRESGKGGFIISWEGDHSSADHGGWWVGRSGSAVGPFILLHEKELSKTAREYVDETPIPLITNYYVVYSTDVSGNKNISNPNAAIRTDSIAPAQPKLLTGFIDSTGIVTLQWEPGNETDLMGYRVFRATARDREYYQMTSNLVGDNYFQDKVELNTTSEEVFYKIIALDFHYNPSVDSDILILKLPDTIAPAAAIISSFDFTENGVSLHWKKSAADDVSMYRLWRRKADSDWEMIRAFAAADTPMYEDGAIQWNTTYWYALETMDDANNSTGRDREVRIPTPARAPKGQFSNVTGSLNGETKHYTISWKYDGPSPQKFVIYRGVDDAPLEYYGEVQGDAMTFADKAFYKTEKGYAYQINALYADGSTRSMTSPYVVNVTK